MFSSSYITDLSKIESELAEIQTFLELPSPSDNPASLTKRLEILSQHMARSGKLKSDAEYHYNTVLSSSIIEALKTASKLSPSTLNKYIESLCKDYKQIVSWAERANRTATHQCENLRTLISYAKSEMSLR